MLSAKSYVDALPKPEADKEDNQGVEDDEEDIAIAKLPGRSWPCGLPLRGRGRSSLSRAQPPSSTGGGGGGIEPSPVAACAGAAAWRAAGGTCLSGTAAAGAAGHHGGAADAAVHRSGAEADREVDGKIVVPRAGCNILP